MWFSPFLNVMGVEQRGPEARPEGPISGAAKVAEAVSTAIPAVGPAAGPLGIASAVEKFAGAKTTDEGNRAIGEGVSSVGECLENLPGVGQAVGAGLSFAGKAANFMEDSSRAWGLYGKNANGTNQNISDHAADVAIRATHKEGDEHGPTVGGALIAGGQAVVDGITWAPRALAKGAESAFNAITGRGNLGEMVKGRASMQENFHKFEAMNQARAAAGQEPIPNPFTAYAQG